MYFSCSLKCCVKKQINVNVLNCVLCTLLHAEQMFGWGVWGGDPEIVFVVKNFVPQLEMWSSLVCNKKYKRGAVRIFFNWSCCFCFCNLTVLGLQRFCNLSTVFVSLKFCQFPGKKLQVAQYPWNREWMRFCIFSGQRQWYSIVCYPQCSMCVLWDRLTCS